MAKKEPDFDLIPKTGLPSEQAARQRAEIDRVVLAAHALELDAPIVAYRIVGERIELWTIHGGPYIYSPAQASPPPAPLKKKVIRTKK